jgi:hypothetical protein
VKSPAADLQAVAASEQVLGYLKAYRQVLVTNLRDFLLLGLDPDGKPVELERFVLAPTEAEFWALAAHPRLTEQAHGPRFTEFLKRVLLSTASLAAPQDLAWFLASYAREARALTESAELPTLDAVRESMEEALGVKFEGAKGEHFFRSTLRTCCSADSESAGAGRARAAELSASPAVLPASWAAAGVETD